MAFAAAGHYLIYSEFELCKQSQRNFSAFKEMCAISLNCDISGFENSNLKEILANAPNRLPGHRMITVQNNMETTISAIC